MELTAVKVTELFLRAVAFSMLCGIIIYMLYVIAAYFMAVLMIAQFVFGTMSGSPWVE
jgi:hypothetical protein